MDKSKLIALILSILLAVPPCINLTGWNLYAYLALGKSDVVFASALGSCHIALSEHYEESELLGLYELGFEENKRDLLHVGPLEIFAEKRTSHFQFLSFHMLPPSSNFYYAGIEFPWLLLFLIPYVIVRWASRRNT